MNIDDLKANARMRKQSLIQKILLIDGRYSIVDLYGKTLKQLEALYEKVKNNRRLSELKRKESDHQ